MEPDNTESTSKPFNRREWLLTIALIMVVEFGIFSVSHTFSGEQNIINYVSFASTIASILLAVIAIIYSFVQTDSQQKTGNAIASQIDHLKQASIQINNSKDQLENQLNRISGVAEKIDGLQELVGSKITNVQESLSQIQNEIKSNLKPVSAPHSAIKPGSISDDAALLAILHTTFDADLFAYALQLFAQKPDLNFKWIDFVSTHYATPLSNIENHNYSNYLAIGLQIYAPLRHLGFITEIDGRVRLSDYLINYLATDKVTVKSTSEKITKNLPAIQASFAS